MPRHRSERVDIPRKYGTVRPGRRSRDDPI
jgi:hypothetical protein